jgi:hypothetical protein
MEKTKSPHDFTVPVPRSEKVAMALVIALLSGGLLFLIRNYSLSRTQVSIAFNFFFAVGLLGTIRLARLALEQKNRGLIIKDDSIQVNTLILSQEIPISEITDQVLICTKDQKNQSQISFLWGQNRFRLPCSQTTSLAQFAELRGLRFLVAPNKDLELQNIVEKTQNLRAKNTSRLKFSGAAIFAFSLWITGIVGIIFVS